MSLKTKFVLVLSLSFVVLALLVGFAVTAFFRANLRAEILRFGYGQTLALRSFGQRVFDDARNLSGRTADYAGSTQRETDGKLLQKLVENEPRLYSVAVLQQPSRATKMVENPSEVIVYGGAKPEGFGPPEDTALIPPPGDEAAVEIWEKSFHDESGEVPALFFRVPIESQGKYALANVLVTVPIAHINREVNNLLIKIAIFGAAFLAVGIAIALGLAGGVTRPVTQLVQDMNVIAQGDLDHMPQVISRDEMGLLATALSRMTKSLAEAREQEMQVQRLAGDLDLAKEIVAKLMPSKLPKLPGYDVATLYYCAREVGGDYYDFIPVDNEHLAILVADVSGKSIGGALVVSTTRTVLRLMSSGNLSPADVLSKTNYHVARDIRRGMFVTVFYGILNVRTREFNVASAGHNPMMLYRGQTKEVELINPSGMGMGFDRGPLFDKAIREKKLLLRPGDRVLLYTDGIVESMNEAREEWGDDALIAYLKAHAPEKSRDFVNGLKEALAAHQGNAEQHDDITATTLLIE
ncbi:MAG: SpoIIE family protein phosphatase [Planctomycetota bacterium]|nr:SpoIIE family protein phosphatase [Planctomycetota bacterium]